MPNPYFLRNFVTVCLGSFSSERSRIPFDVRLENIIEFSKQRVVANRFRLFCAAPLEFLSTAPIFPVNGRCNPAKQQLKQEE